jgi:hypothetical protein
MLENNKNTEIILKCSINTLQNSFPMFTGLVAAAKGGASTRVLIPLGIATTKWLRHSQMESCVLL